MARPKNPPGAAMSVEEYRARESEDDFQSWVIGYAEAHGWRVYHAHTSMKLVKKAPHVYQAVPDAQQTGFPDLTMVRNGRIVFAELKTARGRVEDEQREWLQDLESAALRVPGAIEVYLWRPVNRPQIEHVLR